MHFRWLWGFCLDFVFCALRSAEILCFGEVSPLHWLYFCILAFVLLALCCDFVFLYFRSSARISVMCQCAHLDTVLPPSSSTFPLSIQIVHKNILPLKYVHTYIIPLSHVLVNIMFFSWMVGAQKILYNQRGYNCQSYKLSKEDQENKNSMICR